LTTLNHIITNFSGVGGAEMMLIKLIKSMPSYNHRVISLMGISDEFKLKLSRENVHFYSLNCKNALSLFLSVFKIKRLLKEKQETSLIIAWMYHACFVAGILALLGRSFKVFFNIRHSLDNISSEKFSTKLAIKFTCFLSKFVNGSIFCSQNALIQHQEYGYKGKLIYIPNGIEVDLQTKLENREFHSQNVIGTLGRFHSAKDYPNLLKAFRFVLDKRPNTQLKIGGNGATFSNRKFRKIVDENNIPYNRITLYGQVKETQQFYSNIDVFVLASKTEGFPNVLLEAMYNFLPVVSTDVGDARQIIPSKGMLVEAQNPQYLADLILSVLDLNEDKLKNMAKINHQYIMDNYTIESVSKSYQSVLSEVNWS
jgi:glycosyltransferase involved in cell wall biosynthesis